MRIPTVLNSAPFGDTAVYLFILIGQSNMVGQGAWDDGLDYPDGVLQLGQDGEDDGEFIQAVHRLQHVTPTTDRFGPALQCTLDWLAARPNDTIVLCPCAEGGTGFSTGDWEVGQGLYNNAIARANVVMAAYPDAIPIIFWQQGEADGDAGGSWVTDYTEHFEAMIAGMRANITGASVTTPVIVGELGAYRVANNADYEAINNQLKAIPSRMPYSAFVAADDLSLWPDNVHFDAPAVRTLGSRYHVAARSVIETTMAAQLDLIPGQTRTIDVSDVSSMRVGRDGSGGVPGVGDPVGLIVYKDGMGGRTVARYMQEEGVDDITTLPHAEAPNDSSRPTYTLNGDKPKLQFDGSNSRVEVDIPNRSTTTGIYAAMYTEDVQGMLVSNPSNAFAGLWWEGNGTAQTGTVEVNGVVCATRDATWSELDATPATFDLTFNTSGSSAWDTAVLFYFGPNPAYRADAQLFGLYETDTALTDAQLALIDAWRQDLLPSA